MVISGHIGHVITLQYIIDINSMTKLTQAYDYGLLHALSSVAHVYNNILEEQANLK